MVKNEDIKIKITGMTSDGNGVGRHEGMAVFVPLTAIGDEVLIKIVKLQKNYAFGKLLKVETPSPDRITPECECYNQCGGCVYRHIDYGAELKIKSDTVRDALSRIGGINVPLCNILSSKPDGYRNKAQYPINADGKTGFFAARSHRIIPVDNCRLQPSEFTKIAKMTELWIKQYGISVYNEETGRGLLRHLYIRTAASGDIMVVLVINGENLPHSAPYIDSLKMLLGDSFKSLVININRKMTNVILGDCCRTLYGDGYIVDELLGVKLRVSPLSFSQVNHDMAEKLYAKAAEYAEPDGKTIIDLYCGTGAIGLTMARRAESIIGVEIVPEAIEDANFNAKLNKMENTRFICDDAAGAAKKLRAEGVRADVVIVDPPRKGCTPELIETVANGFCPERVVYVSCDPATLARDLKIFEGYGYSVKSVTPADLFPRTAHVETVVRIDRV